MPNESQHKTPKIDVHKNELTENNSFYDITGNMSIWRVHETYEGSGNEVYFSSIVANSFKETKKLVILK